MIEDGLNHKFDVILTKSISRFARNTLDTLIDYVVIGGYDENGKNREIGLLKEFEPLLICNEFSLGENSPLHYLKQQFIKSEKASVKRNNIMLVTHSGVINIIYYIVKKMNWSNKQKAFPASNTCITNYNKFR